jgi:hypothetical protein
MKDELILGLIGLTGGLIAIITPIVRLNGNIVRLTTVVEQLERLVESRTKELADRITKHGEEIDELKADSVDHEARIKALER